MKNLLITDPSELKILIKSALEEYDQDKANKKGEILLTVNQVAKRLGKAHATIKKMIQAKTIRATKDNLISEASLKEYLCSELKEVKKDTEKRNPDSEKKRMSFDEMIELFKSDDSGDSEDFKAFKASFEMLQEKRIEKARSEGRLVIDDLPLSSEMDKDIKEPEPFQ